MANTKMNLVNWFEIPVRNMERARKFYEKVLGIKLALSELKQEWGKFEMAWFPMTPKAPGATGSLIKGLSYKPSHSGTVVYFTVKSISATLRKVSTAGGKVVMPKTSIGEYGSIAHFEDTEGNRVALHMMK